MFLSGFLVFLSGFADSERFLPNLSGFWQNRVYLAESQRTCPPGCPDIRKVLKITHFQHFSDPGTRLLAGGNRILVDFVQIYQICAKLARFSTLWPVIWSWAK